MNAARLRAGELVTGAGALLLLVMLFLDWARPEPRVRTSPGIELSTPLQSAADRVVGAFVGQFAQSGWSAIGWFLVLMLVLSIVGAFALVAFTVLEQDTPVLAIVTAVLLAGWSIITVIVLLVRLTLLQPGLAFDWDARDVDILAPAWFGLLGLVAIAVGAWLTMRDDRLDSPQSAPAPVPVRPVPPAGA